MEVNKFLQDNQQANVKTQRQQMTLNLPPVVVLRLSTAKPATVTAIAVSAKAEANARKQALATGFQSYVTKPIDFKVVVDAVLRLKPSAA
jgi:CheY-like chemotaxis protein